MALWRETPCGVGEIEVSARYVPYPGYAKAVNILTRTILRCDPACSWIVTGGDDTEPDPANRPHVIAAQCREYFGGGTYGVMQPTGDRWADGAIDRICGSPWMGREFCERAYGGDGPLWHQYTHMFVDEELHDVAAMHGVLWQRRDLIHLHNHFTRDGNSVNWTRNVPDFLKNANSREHWARYRSLFLERKAAGFPGHEPLPA